MGLLWEKEKEGRWACWPISRLVFHKLAAQKAFVQLNRRRLDSITRLNGHCRLIRTALGFS